LKRIRWLRPTKGEGEAVTVREVLDEKRRERKDDLSALVLCKYELFYLPETGLRGDSVYPVTEKQAEEEAEWFGVEWSKQ